MVEPLNEVSQNQELQKNESVLSILKSQSILTNQDWVDLDNAKGFIKDCFTSIPMYRPLPVKLFGVLNDKECPTPESKLWQCKIESEVHADQLIEDIHNLEILRITIERLEYTLTQMVKGYEIEDDENIKKEIEFDIRENKVRLSKLEYKVVKIQKQIKYRIEEVSEWKKISNAIEQSHEGIETKNYVKQYVNNMRFKLLQQLKSENDEETKSRLNSQIQSFDRITEQMQNI